MSKVALLFILFSGILFGLRSQAQTMVALDNWFNCETNAKTGLPFHYLWNDTADSGYSRWGRIFTDKGAVLCIMKKPTAEKLEAIGIYIIVDPDSVAETPYPNFIDSADQIVIENWVKNGGVLVLMANDGKHCGLTSLNQLSARFGIVFNNVMLRPVTQQNYEMGAFTAFPDHPVFMNVKKIFMKETASIDLSGNAKAVLSDNGNVVMAECKFGKGFVFVVGDPWIYNEYIDHDRLPADFENRKAAENLTEYLLLKTN